MKHQIKLISVVVGIVFIVASLMTIQDYNSMWDARNHFYKGQAFANYFLRGWKNYDGLPVTPEYVRYYRDYISKNYEQPDIEKRLSTDPDFRRSIYQDDVHTFEWLMQKPATEHPVFSDILSSIANIVLYEKLGWMRDDRSYHVLSIVLAGMLVSVLYYWSGSLYGRTAAIIATLALVTKPLFWAESHYNIKDIPLLVFFSCAVWCWHQGITRRLVNWLLLSAVLAGFAFATKFNAVFLPFILGPWTLVHMACCTSSQRWWYVRRWWVAVLYPAIMLMILYLTWPQLWYEPVKNFISVVSYYREVGVNIDYTPEFRTIGGFSTYPYIWVWYRTYPLVIVLGIIGLYGACVRLIKCKDTTPFLFVMWLIVSLLRASLPGMSVFGGLRHIIEYLTPFAFLAGLGAVELVTYVPARWKTYATVVLVAGFIPFVITLYQMHPAENVYFNSFAGGLAGAREKKLTGWGNTDGGIYRIGLEWINEHAEPNAHIAVGFSELADFYLPEFRDDLIADNYFSGYLQEGEYIIALTHHSELEHTYRMQYAERFLNPVFVYSVDTVPLIKIWKNDADHARPGMSSFKQFVLKDPYKTTDGHIAWDMGILASTVYLDLAYDQTEGCTEAELITFEVSKDGTSWLLLPEAYPAEVITPLGEQPKNGHLIAPFAIHRYRYISLGATPSSACVLNVSSATMYIVP